MNLEEQIAALVEETRKLLELAASQVRELQLTVQEQEKRIAELERRTPNG